MKRLAIDLDLTESRVICVGSSPRLLGKANLCQQAGAGLAWVESEPEHRPDTSFEVIPSEAVERSDTRFALALVDTGIPASDQVWAQRFRAQRIPVWVASSTQTSNLHFPSTLERGSLRIAMDTGGRWPSVARWLRQRVEQVLPEGVGATLTHLERFDQSLKAHLDTPHRRRTFWYRLLDGWLPHRAHLMPSDELDQTLGRMIDQIADDAPAGEVFLVGAGPGDPDLLTLKALRVIGQADVVLYDRLVSADIMALVRADAERVHVGKARAKHTVPQHAINQLLVDYARQGKTVVRLKGGDPFIFGRGGEEIETLAEAGIHFQVVPGITAASGCAAYAGIPLTHRSYAQSVRFVTGHLQDDSCDLPWTDLVQNRQTLVFYMGLVGLPVISRELMTHGMSPDMPVALVSRGTTPEQVVVTGTLKTISDRVEASGVHAPTLIIVGEVVRLREKLDWLGTVGRSTDSPAP